MRSSPPAAAPHRLSGSSVLVIDSIGGCCCVHLTRCGVRPRGPLAIGKCDIQSKSHLPLSTTQGSPNTNCKPCRPGSFASGEGNWNCTLCAKGSSEPGPNVRRRPAHTYLPNASACARVFVSPTASCLRGSLLASSPPARAPPFVYFVVSWYVFFAIILFCW